MGWFERALSFKGQAKGWKAQTQVLDYHLSLLVCPSVQRWKAKGTEFLPLSANFQSMLLNSQESRTLDAFLPFLILRARTGPGALANLGGQVAKGS